MVSPATGKLSHVNNAMSSDKKLPWMVQLRCPFCKEVVVDTYDCTKLPEGVHEEDCGHYAGVCDHVAFHGVWGYEDFSIEKEWEPQMQLVAGAFVREGWLSDEEGQVEFALEFNNEEELLPVMRKAVKDADVDYGTLYVPTGDGPQGNGVASYMYIFMRRKGSRTTSPERKGAKNKKAGGEP